MMLIIPTSRKRKPCHHHEATNQFANFYIKLAASLLVTISLFISVTQISNVFALHTNKTSAKFVNKTDKPPQDVGHIDAQSYVPPITADIMRLDGQPSLPSRDHDDDLTVASATLETFRTSAENPFYAQPLVEPQALSYQPAASQQVEQPEVARTAPSLAELTAAATAAGILVGDMIGQQSELANQQDESGSPEISDNSKGGGGDDDEDDSEGDVGIEKVINQDPGYGLDPNQQQQNDEATLSSRLADQRIRQVGSPAIYTSDQRQLLLNSVPQSAAAEQGEGTEIGSTSDSPELMYDRMPDSMEGLMRLDGEDTSDMVNDDNPQDGSDATEVQQQAPMQLRDGLGVSASSLGAEARSSSEDRDEDDLDDDLDDRDTKPKRAFTGLDDQQITRPLPVYEQQIRGSPLIGPTGQLVSPAMFNSMVDLNTAAGHYYGKKKKKKVKKIVIKKKKKKKKKYKKVKKIKIVKIKKKKKKKKHKKKKHHHHEPDHGKYYMYAKVPKKKSWEFGFKKGNKKHWIERHEKGHKNKFKTKVKWYDKKSKGKGFHIWDYNHHDKKKKYG